MEQIIITINTANAAFDDGNAGVEVARILRELANSLELGMEPETLRDYNGNKVGKVEVTK